MNYYLNTISVFIVNLEKEAEKRKRSLTYCKEVGISAEVYSAIDGASFSKKEGAELLTYPNSFLTNGEIGCALSHLSIYRRMILDNIDIALILEDDFKFNVGREELYHSLNDIKAFLNKDNVPKVVLLNEGLCRFTFGRNIFKNKLCYYIKGNGTYAYMLNKSAAHELLVNAIPIRYEADFWNSFFYRTKLRIYCLENALVVNADINQQNSSLEKERAQLKVYRQSTQANFFKIECKTVKYKIWHNIFIKIIMATGLFSNNK